MGDLLKQAKAAQELLRRQEENKVLFYRPCCRQHKLECGSLTCPSSKHTKFHQSDKRIRVIFGGNRSGKSVAGLVELLFHACLKKHPFTGKANRFPGRYRIWCQDFGTAEKIIIPLLYEWIPKDALKYGKESNTKRRAFDLSYNPRYHILELSQGTTIDIMSYDQDAGKAESVELDGVWADEEMPEYLYSATLARLISRGGRMWLTVTPLYSLTWAMKFMDGVDKNIDVFQTEIWDNPHLKKEDIDAFVDSVPDHEKEARLYGRFIELQGLVYKCLQRDVHLIDPVTPALNWPVVMAMDPHPRKATVITWACITPQEDVVFFDELEVKGTAKEIVSEIKKKEAMHKGPTTLRIIDPAAKGQGSNLAFQTDTLQEFEKEGMGFTLADNSEAGYNVVQEYLTFNHDRDISSTNRPRCYFTKDVPLTWYGMTHLLWDEWKNRTKRGERESVKDWKKDFPDCVRYTLATRPRWESPRKQPTPIGNIANKESRFAPRLRNFFLRRKT